MISLTKLTSQGYLRSKSDLCLYYKVNRDTRTYCFIYVDDIQITGSRLIEINKLKECLKSSFRMKDLGLLNEYLGISITQDVINGFTTMSQKHYLQRVLKRFGMYNCNPTNIPIDPKFDFTTLKRAKSESYEIENKCRQIIGCIMYSMLCTRPDLCSSITFLSRYQNCASLQLYGM